VLTRPLIYLGFSILFTANSFALLHQLNDLLIGHAGGL